MEAVRPIPPTFGPGHGNLPLRDAPATAPRPDLPPVARSEGPGPVAPRPPDHAYLGLVQAGLLASVVPINDYSPERVLKPWGVAILPDSVRAEERREAEADRQAQAARVASPASTPSRGEIKAETPSDPAGLAAPAPAPGTLVVGEGADPPAGPE